MIPKPLAVLIVCLITVVWIANFGAQFLVDGYQVDGWVHTIFLTVVGGALGLSRRGSGQSASPSDEPPATALDPTSAPASPPPPDIPRAGGSHRAPFAFLPRAAI